MKIEGCRRINVFIGYPNVGKSNILEAMALMSYMSTDYSVPYSDLCRVKQYNELFFDGNVRDSIKLNVSGKAQINLEFRNSNEVWAAIRENENIYRAFGFVGDGFDSMVNNAEIDLQKVARYDFSRFILTNSLNGLTLDAPFGGNLVNLIKFNQEIRREVIELLSYSNLKLNIDSRDNTINGLKQLEEGYVYTVPLYQMADTLQRLIFHKAAIMSNENSVLLFEEPEAHMFPPYIRKFTGDVIFRKENNNQYFISTHSPIVVEDFLADAREDLSVYLVGLKDGQTIIKRLTDEQLDEVHDLNVDLFFNIESYMD
jgi:hypothetical protein